MQVVSVNKFLSFNQWKNIDNSLYLFSDLIKQKNPSEMRKLNKEYKNYESDDCTLLLGKMNKVLRDSENIYDYNYKEKVILKNKDGKNMPLNNSPKDLIKGLYKEYQKIISEQKINNII